MKKTKIIYASWECFKPIFEQLHTTREQGKNINPLRLCGTQSKNFHDKVWKSFSREYYSMENKIFGFQFEPVCVKKSRPNYSVGSDQDEAEIQ